MVLMQLNEKPVGHDGEWGGDDKMQYVDSILSDAILSKRFNLIGSYKDYEVYTNKTEDRFLVTTSNGDDKLCVTELRTTEFNIDVSNVAAKQTSMVKTSRRYRRDDVTISLYLKLVEHGYTLVCDYDQYTGAIAMWKSIGHTTYHKYIYDEAKDTIIPAKNFDNDKLWSFNNQSKRYTLLVVSKKELKVKNMVVTEKFKFSSLILK